MGVGFLSSFTAPDFLIRPLLLLNFPAALCLKANSTSQSEGLSVVLGNHVWEMEEHSTGTSLLCLYTSAPTFPQVTSSHCMKNYSLEACLSYANQQN